LSFREQIANLEALDVLDAALSRIDEQIAKEQGVIDELKGELRALDDKLSADKSSLAEMERMRSELSVELRQMSTQIERSREKLSRSRNERESNAAQRELEELRKLQHDREDEIGKFAALAESAKQSIITAETRRKSVADDLAGRETETNAQLGQAGSERATKWAERTRIAATIPGLTLRRYDQVRKKKGSAIAPAADGICLACHMSLPPMLYQKLLRSEVLEQCPSCARILYLQRPTPPEGG
jgi:predicted  nucleic acid-binding Zn-ribbon protein